MAGDNSIGRTYKQELEELNEFTRREEQRIRDQETLRRQQREVMKQLIGNPLAPPPNISIGNIQSAMGQAGRPATLTEQIEGVINARKAQIAVLEHLLATLNLGAFKSDPGAGRLYEQIVDNALAQMK